MEKCTECICALALCNCSLQPLSHSPGWLGPSAGSGDSALSLLISEPDRRNLNPCTAGTTVALPAAEAPSSSVLCRPPSTALWHLNAGMVIARLRKRDLLGRFAGLQDDRLVGVHPDAQRDQRQQRKWPSKGSHGDRLREKRAASTRGVAGQMSVALCVRAVKFSGSWAEKCGMLFCNPTWCCSNQASRLTIRKTCVGSDHTSRTLTGHSSSATCTLLPPALVPPPLFLHLFLRPSPALLPLPLTRPRRPLS